MTEVEEIEQQKEYIAKSEVQYNLIQTEGWQGQ